MGPVGEEELLLPPRLHLSRKVWGGRRAGKKECGGQKAGFSWVKEQCEHHCVNIACRDALIVSCCWAISPEAALADLSLISGAGAVRACSVLLFLRHVSK